MLRTAVKICLDFTIFIGSLHLMEMLFLYEFISPVRILPELYGFLLGFVVEEITNIIGAAVPQVFFLYYQLGAFLFGRIALARRFGGMSLYEASISKHGDTAGKLVFAAMFVFSPLLLPFFVFGAMVYLLSIMFKDLRAEIAANSSAHPEYRTMILVVQALILQVVLAAITAWLDHFLATTLGLS